MRTIFITGTDTGIGKTYVTIKLLQEYNTIGLKTIGLKPVSTGCTNGYNEDALLLQENSSLKLDYSLVNPFAFNQAVSPNIACNNLTVEKIWIKLQETLLTKADICIIEGIGGWFTPLNNQETMADLVAKFQDIEIILVVGLRLGCLNHSLLTYQAINRPIAGWIANVIDPKMEAIEENIATVKQYISEPYLGMVPYF